MITMKRLLTVGIALMVLAPMVGATAPSAELIEYSNQACPTGSAKFGLQLANQGQAVDTYEVDVNVPWHTAAPQTVQLQPGEQKTSYIWLQPPADMSPGTYDFRVTATSGNSGDSVARTGTLDVLSCRAVDLAVPDTSQTVCRGDRATYHMDVENTGGVAETYELSTDYGELSTSKVQLEPGQSTTVQLTASSGQATEREINVDVQSTTSYAQDTETLTFTSETCRGARLFLSPSEKTVCEDDRGTYTATLWNTGKIQDTYDLITNAQVGIDEVALNPGESVSFQLAANRDVGDHVLHLRAASQTFENFEVSQDARMSVDNCWDLQLGSERENTVTVNNSNNELLEFALINNGSRENTYSLSFDGPEWADIRPIQTTVAPGETGTAYLYVAPDYFSDGSYSSVLTVTDDSGTIQKTIDVDITVGEDTVTAETDGADVGLTGRISSSVSGTGGIIVLVLVLAGLFLGGYWYFRNGEAPVEPQDGDEPDEFGGEESWDQEPAQQDSDRAEDHNGNGEAQSRSERLRGDRSETGRDRFRDLRRDE